MLLLPDHLICLPAVFICGVVYALTTPTTHTNERAKVFELHCYLER